MPKGYCLATGADVAPWRDYAVKALGEWGIAKLDGGMKIDGSSYGGQVSKRGEDEELGHLLVVKLAGSPGTPGGSVGKEGSTFAVQLLRRSFQTHPEEYVTRVLMSPDGTRATGVLYVDAQGREVEQPAEMVLLTAYGLHNARLMMLSGIGETYDPATGRGTVGRNYAYQAVTSATVFFVIGLTGCR